MNTLFAGVHAGLSGAMRLACGQADGVRIMQDALGGVAGSFRALALCMPILIALRLMAWSDTVIPANPGRVLSRDMAMFTVAWLGFAVFSWHLSGLFKRQENWPRFIVAWNWCSVVQNLLVLAGAVPQFLGAPTILSQVAQFVVMGWALWLEWYAVRLTLGVGMLTAAWIVLIDESLSLTVASIGFALSGR